MTQQEITEMKDAGELRTMLAHELAHCRVNQMALSEGFNRDFNRLRQLTGIEGGQIWGDLNDDADDLIPHIEAGECPLCQEQKPAKSQEANTGRAN